MTALNLPNLLTFFRIVASFGVLVFGLQGRWNLAFPIFCVAAVTDMVDGSIARILGQRTRLGAFLDPAADKLLMFFSFLTLTIGGYLPIAFFVLVVARDLLITVGVIILKANRVYIVYRPTYLSKVTTFAQILTIFAAMVATQRFRHLWEIPYDMVWAYLLGVTTLLTALTGVQYFRIGWELLKTAPGKKAGTV